MKTIEELENEMNKLAEEIKELKGNEKGNGLWKPKEGEKYYYVDLDTMKVFAEYYDYKIDNIRCKHKVVFETEEEAEEYLEYLKAKEKAQNEFSREEWKDKDINKYYFGYDNNNEDFYEDVVFSAQILNQTYFRTQEDRQVYIDKYEKCIRREMEV